LVYSSINSDYLGQYEPGYLGGTRVREMCKRIFALISVAVILIFVISACGPKEETTTGQTLLTSASPVEAVAEQTKTPVELAEESPISTPFVSPTLSPTPTAPPSERVSMRVESVVFSNIEVVKALTPSVVQIVTETTTRNFLNRPVPSSGVGTGIILSEDGYILTNNHVVDGAQQLTVTLSNGESYPAEIVGTDLDTDTAVIRIEASGLSLANLGNSSELQVGEKVIAIGHALGLPGGPTVSAGVISAVGRSIDTSSQTTIADLIQTDAAINPGNSGGPLVNDRAEVIGINMAIIQGAEGIGFAINIDDAKIVIEQILGEGYVERGFLGITPVNLTPALASQLGLPVRQGILLTRVLEGSASERAGLRTDDVIVQMGDKLIENTGKLSNFLLEHLLGETIDLTFYRDGVEMSTRVTLGERSLS
jgi:serine protease Do